MSQEWDWLAARKRKQPPLRDSTGKIIIRTDVKDMTVEDINNMSQSQMLNSWRCATGIMNSKMELLQARLNTTESLLYKYQTDVNKINKGTFSEHESIYQKIREMQDQLLELQNSLSIQGELPPPHNSTGEKGKQKEKAETNNS